MKLRFAVAFALAVLGSVAMIEAQGKSEWAPPADPPDTLLEHACSLLPDEAAAWVPFCDA